MAAGAKLQKSFQDYFRIPILLKPLGNTSQQTLSQISSILNQIDRFPINEQYFPSQTNESPEKYKRNSPLYQRLKNDLKNRRNQESQKLLFLSEDFANDWSQFQIVYKTNFIILVYDSTQNTSQNMSNSGGNPLNLNESIQKISLKLKQKDKKLLGIIFLNDSHQFSKTLISGLKFTIIPPSLPMQQLSMFMQPWLSDFIPSIQTKLLQQILECQNQQNSIIVFNRSEDKSEPKIMKKKKKYRCLKICGDLALTLHLYKFAYEVYHQADEQLRKVDDWMWILGCIQGKLACMTCNAQLNVSQQNIQKQIQELIAESFSFSKKIKYQSFEIQNLFKILKLLLYEDKQRFDDMVETALSASKGLTEQQKFIYYSYIGSMYSKAGMERKRNYFYYRASLITQKFKPEVSEVLLKTIKSSKYLAEWEYLNSKIIQKIVQSEKYFTPDAEMHLELIQKCSSVLQPKQIQMVKDYLNFGNYSQTQLKSNTEQLIQIKQLIIEESQIKPKPNRLISDQSPKKASKGIFVGWKKKQTWLYEEQQKIIFKGTIINKLPFQVRIKMTLIPINLQQSCHSFSLILPPLYPYKLKKLLPFKFSESVVTIKKIKISIWNFGFYKSIEPEVSFELYEKQPKFQINVQGGTQFWDQKDQKNKINIEVEQSSLFSLRCSLLKQNQIPSYKLRVTCSVYYDIDVGFQQNQFNLSVQNNFFNIDFKQDLTNPNIKFVESQQKQSSIQYDQVQKILVMRLKKFKTGRQHIKRLQINLDYIKSKESKYQINKQFTIQTKITNSIGAEIISISTPQLRSTIKNLQNPTDFQLNQIRMNWNVIQEFYLARIRFFKDKFNLRPFKIWYQKKGENDKSFVFGKNQVILSNLTEGQMQIKLQKIPISLQQKLRLFNNSKSIEQGLQNIPVQSLKFQWQNIVNRNMKGSIKIKVNQSVLIFRPKIDIHIDVEQTQQSISCKSYKLTYSISSEQKQSIRPHKISIKSYSGINNYAEPVSNQPQNISNNQAQQQANVSNINILVKGKTKVNKIGKYLQSLSKVQQNKKIKTFKNTLILRVIKEKLHEKIQEKQKIQSIDVIVIIEFDQKEIGKYQQAVKLF